MEITILDKNLTPVAIMDTYESFIWTDRYRECGDFELYTPMIDDILTYIKQDYYLCNRDSEHVMIIESLRISSDTESGNYLTVTGRSLESILDRRIVWGQRTLSGNFQNAVENLLNENIISPSNNDRKIDNFIFEASDDPIITSLNVNAQYIGENLYNIIQKLCTEFGVAFKITLNDNNQFVFKLYAGVDRSYGQTKNPYVIFSPNFDNIINSNYIESKSIWKNVTLVGGEGEGSARKYATVGSGTGLDRREIFTDASSVSSEVDDVQLSDEAYVALLQQEGKATLVENAEVISFEGEIEATLMFKYGEDFFNGDIVQVANEYGHETRARIIEMVISENEEGKSIYPTYETIQEGV